MSGNRHSVYRLMGISSIRHGNLFAIILEFEVSVCQKGRSPSARWHAPLDKKEPSNQCMIKYTSAEVAVVLWVNASSRFRNVTTTDDVIQAMAVDSLTDTANQNTNRPVYEDVTNKIFARSQNFRTAS
ncbi:hypothetical protein J6590_029139 [Homalodisca vitripennis]|nr:hypothetical protein J6590_029139 [Homalodisca vitripennis]